MVPSLIVHVHHCASTAWGGCGEKRGFSERVAMKIYEVKRVWVPFIAKRGSAPAGHSLARIIVGHSSWMPCRLHLNREHYYGHVRTVNALPE